MKKIYTFLSAAIVLCSFNTKAQDTLLFNDFQNPHFVIWDYTTPINHYPKYQFYDTTDSPFGYSTDSVWFLFNANPTLGNAATTYRSVNWFLSYPFSTRFDRYQTGLGLDTFSLSPLTVEPDSNTVLAANSWTNLGDGPDAEEQNYCITPSIQLGNHDTLFWKSAPRQTPRYLDRYSVLVSHNTTNAIANFTDTIFRAGEMYGNPPGGSTGTDTVFADFQFSCYNGNVSNFFIHGLDSTYMDPISAAQTAPISHNGRLRPFSTPLDAYANQTVFIAFLADSHDDNLISIDDILIRGDRSTAGIKTNNLNISLSVFPNPARESAQLNFNLSKETPLTISIYDIAGKLIYSENKGTMSEGRHFDVINTASLAKGFYTIAIQTNDGRSNVKLIVQ